MVSSKDRCGCLKCWIALGVDGTRAAPLENQVRLGAWPCLLRQVKQSKGCDHRQV
jgi:hypothetical protein